MDIEEDIRVWFAIVKEKKKIKEVAKPIRCWFYLLEIDGSVVNDMLPLVQPFKSLGILWNPGDRLLIFVWEKVPRHCSWVLTRNEHFTKAHSVSDFGFPDFCLFQIF